ncbi:MAG: recombinase family protein, partial [Alphaproteobacteria bacterium]
MTKRAVIYARYSSDLQSDASIEDQVRLCEERLQSEGNKVVQVYQDRAISGGSVQNRDGIQRLMEAVRLGGVDLVMAEALDRLSRDQEDIAAIFKRLQFAGVTLTTLAEGEISELHIGLKGTMNALFLKDLADKTRRGQRGRVEKGRIPGGKSYGYNIVHSLKDNGQVERGQRTINEAEASVVRRIFSEYVAGNSPRKIAALLNAEMIPSPRGGQWNASTINGNQKRRNGILNNELYLGRITYNRQRFVKDPDTGKRRSRPNPQKLWVITHVPELQIIDQDIWDKTQSLKQRYFSHRGNKRQTKKRLLSGLVKCGGCGGSMTIVNRQRYSCSTKREKGTCDNPAGIQAERLEARVIEGLKNILLGRDDLLKEFASAFFKETVRLRHERNRQKQTHQSELAKVQRSIDRCLDFIINGDGAMDTVRQKLSQLERSKTNIQNLMDQDTTLTNIEPHPNMGQLYQRRVEQLTHLLNEESNQQEAVTIIRSLIDRIEITPGEKRGDPQVQLVGGLAAILELAASRQQKTTIQLDSGFGRVLMVAGAGFEPAT